MYKKNQQNDAPCQGMKNHRRVLAEQPINSEEQKPALIPFAGPVRGHLQLAPVTIKVEPKQEADELLPFTGPVYPPVVRPLPPRLAVLPLAHNKRFTCEICKKGVGTRGGLMYHIQAHLNGRAFKCNICDKSYSTKNDYDTHNKRHVGKTFECEFCKRVFKVKQYLADHITAGHLPKSLKCKRCSKLFAQKKILTKHLLTCDKKNSPVVGVCKFCKKKFNVTRLLQEHLNKAIQMRHRCLKCKAKFSCRSLFLAHNKLSKQCQENGEKCRECDFRCKTFKSLNDHIKKCHFSTVHQCDLCSFKSSSYITMYEHQRACGTFSQIRKLGFYCAPCDWYFRKNSQLQEHRDLVHSSNKCSICLHGVKGYLRDHKIYCQKQVFPYKCIPCNVRFSKKAAFNGHFKSHWSPTLDRSKSFCDFCKEGLSSRLNLQSHIEINHFPANSKTSNFKISKVCNKRNQYRPENTFQCNTCGNVFNVKQNLADHIISNHFPKLFRCDRCGKLFASEIFLSSHLRFCGQKHCKFCGLTTRRSTVLQQHMDKARLMRFQCTCKKKFPCRKLYDAHRKTCKKYSKKPILFKCGKCSLRFKTHKSRNAHFKTNHTEIVLKCDLCRFKTNNNKALYEHKRACGTFAQTCSLGLHCPPCNWYFRTESQLQKHKVLVHSPKKCNRCLHGIISIAKHGNCSRNNWPYRCIPCNVKFSTRSTFNGHFKSHWSHNMERDKIICEFCKKCFQSSKKRYLLSHIKMRHFSSYKSRL